MLDFIKIKKKDKGTVIYPDFLVSRRIKDLMVRGGAFYAIWDEERGLWSTDEYDVQRLVDKELYTYNEQRDNEYGVASLEDDSSKQWMMFKNYVKRLPDNYHELDCNVIFADTPCNREDYASKRLPYSMKKAKTPAYDKLISTLYSEEEREKFEWAIGSIIAGDSKTIQKFIVFYGESGSGKSTVMNIIEKLFEGYYTTFDAKSMAQSNNAFSLEAFKNNPLIAIQQDGDLSKIEDNTKLNSIISHEHMLVNEKFKSKYTMQFKTFLFMGTNSPVKITDARSGMNRRLIDIHPTNKRVSYEEYNELVKKIDFELGGIAQHCLDLYLERGSGYYNGYVPIDMISSTNTFYDFICENSETFKKEEIVSLRLAWTLYKEYVDYARLTYPLTLQRFKEEMKAYFEEFIVDKSINGVHIRNSYRNFRKEKIDILDNHEKKQTDMVKNSWLEFEEVKNSVFDIMASDYPAQLANEKGTPKTPWKSTTTTLKDIPTSLLHYVKVPESHIVIDFDIKNSKGEKDLKANIKAASKWPETYAEVSKSGSGIHLHYIYDGDVNKLSRIYDNDIEIKIFTGNSSLRRKLSLCVNKQIAHINSGLPLKGDTGMVNDFVLKNEKALRTIIRRNLLKEYSGYTKPSINLIHKTLEEAYNSGMVYDVRDMRPMVQAFALNSTNNSDYCIKMVSKMHFCSDTESSNKESKDDIVIFDLESWSNVFILCYKFKGDDKKCIKLINPKSYEIEELFKYRLVGFNNLSYDNHLLYAASMGYSVEELNRLSHALIDGSPNAKFREAKNISFTDVYDFAAKKQSLKKWEIELGIHHKENSYDWDLPLPEEHWEEAADYCCNDVLATEAVFDHLASDFLAREILAEIAGMTPNDSTNSLTTRIIFGSERHPKLVYTDLATGEQS